MSTQTREQPKMPAGAKLAYKGDQSAADAVDVSERTIRRAVQNTDPTVYPPPLTPDGRHGENGARAYLASTLIDWVKACAQFDI